ncbi:hypothetical protein LVJ94_22975 [Pendulispora rubella]|uniref:Uncharacterized protein n=1 Tax=Pendulispora rubella TaxID=2741070 RepID=A0ABZ2LJQ3_9BACT
MMRSLRFLVPLLVAMPLACAGRAAPESRVSVAAADDTGWVRDIVDGSRDLTVNLHPKKLSHDPIYGPLVRKASRLAAGESRSSYLGSTTLEVLEQSDEVLLAVRSSHPLDAVIIVSGVPSGVDVEKVRDDDGRSPWKEATRMPNGLLALSSRESNPPGTLYVVGERTWVLGVGPAAERLHERLVERGGRTTPRAPSTLAPSGNQKDAPLSIKLQGELLDSLRGVARSGLRPIFDQLSYVRLALASGDQGNLEAVFLYEQDKAAERAKGRAQELITVVPEKISPNLAFLRDATIERSGRSVQVTAKLPRQFLRGLADAEKE